MDEPANGLDYGNQIRLLHQISDLAKEGFTFIKSTHAPDHALWIASRVLMMKEGRIIAEGRPGEVIDGAAIRELYGTRVEVCSMNGGLRMCVPHMAPLEVGMRQPALNSSRAVPPCLTPVRSHRHRTGPCLKAAIAHAAASCSLPERCLDPFPMNRMPEGKDLPGKNRRKGEDVLRRKPGRQQPAFPGRPHLRRISARAAGVRRERRQRLPSRRDGPHREGSGSSFAPLRCFDVLGRGNVGTPPHELPTREMVKGIGLGRRGARRPSAGGGSLPHGSFSRRGIPRSSR